MASVKEQNDAVLNKRSMPYMINDPSLNSGVAVTGTLLRDTRPSAETSVTATEWPERSVLILAPTGRDLRAPGGKATGEMWKRMTSRLGSPEAEAEKAASDGANTVRDGGGELT